MINLNVSSCKLVFYRDNCVEVMIDDNCYTKQRAVRNLVYRQGGEASRSFDTFAAFYLATV